MNSFHRSSGEQLYAPSIFAVSKIGCSKTKSISTSDFYLFALFSGVLLYTYTIIYVVFFFSEEPFCCFKIVSNDI